MYHVLLSKELCFGNGVRQGWILSPKLFSVYVDDLSLALSGTRAACIYADDLCIMSASPSGFQERQTRGGGWGGRNPP